MSEDLLLDSGPDLAQWESETGLCQDEEAQGPSPTPRLVLSPAAEGGAQRPTCLGRYLRSLSVPTVMPHPQRFSGESIVSWSDLDITISVPWYLGLMFRTRKEDGVLMEATAGASSRLHLQVSGAMCLSGTCSCLGERTGQELPRHLGKAPPLAPSCPACPGALQWWPSGSTVMPVSAREAKAARSRGFHGFPSSPSLPLEAVQLELGLGH